MATTLAVNKRVQEVDAAPDTPLLYVLMNQLALQGPRFGCGLAQCGACSVLVDGVETRSCVTPLERVAGKAITTLEGLPAWDAEKRKLATVPELQPIQQAVIDEQALQCSYCYNGMMIKAAELLSKQSAAHRPADSHRDERRSFDLHTARSVVSVVAQVFKPAFSP